MKLSKSFLKAEWRKLVIVNYKVSPEILKKYMPAKTVPDLWRNISYVSLVGFMFNNVKVKGISIPFHTDFEEVNLRFYVKYLNEFNNEWKRGVVFIKEIVPKPAISFIANNIYKENYVTRKMIHEMKIKENRLEITYAWKSGSKWNSIKVVTETVDTEIERGSEEEFITEHFWGYTRLSETRTSEYEVVHPRWSVYKVKDYTIEVDFEKNYGNEFAFLKPEIPVSVFLAEGSGIEIKSGNVI